MIVTQFIHVAFGTRGSDTTRKYTAHEVDDLADVRQLLDVLGEKVQDVDPEFEMQSLENIMDGSFMIWLQDTSKGSTSADGAQLIQRSLHVLPHSHYPLCHQGLSVKHIITTANAIWAYKRALHVQSDGSVRAISHNLTLGYIIGYDKYRSLSPHVYRFDETSSTPSEIVAAVVSVTAM